ncbi:MAG: hypothetical protein IT431_01975 [Phycisphaerales bacterium]|nr:hypothetical protein [Phycisphaerales bacterium]
MMTQLTPLALLTLLAPVALGQPGPADPEPRWWKGNLHTHSLWSDGDDFPEMIALWYADNGYNFLALSDHNTLSQGQRWMPLADIDNRSRAAAFPKYLERFGDDWVQTRTENDTTQVRLKPFDEYRPFVEQPGRFLLIQAEEITGAFERRPIHINATNLAEVIPPQTGETAEATIRAVLREVNAQAAKHGREVLPHLNHPNFGWGVTAEDLAPVLEEQFFEVFNGHTGVNNNGDQTHASTERIWDIINTIRITRFDAPPIFGIATDDGHSYHGQSPVSIPGRGWVMVHARRLTPETVILAMKAGDFYASTGVTLDAVEFDAADNTLTVRIHPEPGESYTTRFIGTPRDADLTATPVTDEAGNPLPVTGLYSPEIGQVLAESEGVTAVYTFTGDELYVRAVIESSAPPERPTKESLLKRAWTQPIRPAPAG